MTEPRADTAWEAAVRDLRATVRTAGGGEREVTLIAVAVGRRVGRPHYHGAGVEALLRGAARRLRRGATVEMVLEDLAQ